MPLSAATEAHLERLLRAHQADRRAPAVAAAVVADGAEVWASAVGLADVNGLEATTRTPFRIGSITKTFTALLVLRLRDAGELRLDDPLTDHVSGVGTSRVTIRQALSHLSGLQREPPGRGWDTGEMPDWAGLEASMHAVEWVLPPGRRFHYSNLAFALLGRVVEERTGGSWAGAVHDQILVPLSMHDTHVGRPDDAAVGYFVHPHTDAAMAEKPVDTASWSPAGQLWSTVHDLGRLAGVIADPDESGIVPKATLDEMSTLMVMQETQRWTLGYGLGLMLVRRGDRLLAGHAGAMPGFLAAMFVSRADGVGAAVLTNTGRGADPVDLAGQLVDATLDGDPPSRQPWRPPAPVPDELAGVLGSWWLEGVEVVVSWRGGALEGRMAGAPDWREPTRWEVVEADRLRTVAGAEVGEWLLVHRDDDGAVTHLHWAGYPLTRTPQPMLPDAG